MGSDTIDLGALFGLLKRRFWVIAFTTFLALGAAGLAILALKPVYTSTALVLVDPTRKNLLDPDAQTTWSGTESLRVDSEVELVKSETTLLAVVDELQLASDPEFGLRLGLRDNILAFLRISEPKLPTGEEALATIVDKLGESITVQRRGLTFLIAVTARSQRPAFAAQLANAVARAYIAQQLQAKISSTLDSAAIIEDRLEQASATVAQSERAFDDFVDSNLSEISAATGRNDLLQLRTEIRTLNDFRTQSAAVAEGAERLVNRQDWAALAATLQDQALSVLEQQRVTLLERISRTTEGSQAAIDLRAGLADLEAQLASTATSALTGLRTELTQAQARLGELRNQLRQSVLSADLPSEILTSIYSLQQGAEIARAQYQTLLTRQNDLATQAYLQVADSRMVSEATPPVAPSFPNPRLILLLAALGGVGLGVGLALLVENFFGGITSEAQAEALLGIPMVAEVPRQPAPKRKVGEQSTMADLLISSPLSGYAESIRRLRLGIDQAVRRSGTGQSREGGTVIVVTSAAPNEGKTTLALSLMRAYALAGVPALLVDCDLRRPSVHRYLGIPSSDGLLEYLLGTEDVDLKSILAVDAGSGAQIIVGSRRSDVATDQLVAGQTFKRLIAAARKNFDIVILDTPPIEPVVDALYIADLADAIALVVKYSGTPQQEVRSAVEALLSAKREDAPVLSVLNQQVGKSGAYRSRYAGYYAEA